MEISLKKDVIREIKASEGGRILLHDEVETSDGSFEIVPIWESVSEKDVMTPKEVYDLMFAEGYHVNYARIAIVSPLAAAGQWLGTDDALSFIDRRAGSTSGCPRSTCAASGRRVQSRR